MNQKSLYLIIVVVILLAALTYLPAQTMTPPVELPVPEPMIQVDSTTQVSMGLDAMAMVNGTALNVARVEEDSRCPSDVECFWAGQVVLVLNVQSPLDMVEHRVALGETLVTDKLLITLDEVRPYPVSTHQIADGEYSFSFTIKPR